jgi:broad specificity phosphatase PhoE
MRLLLIRHGQTTANVLGSLDTAAPGPSLTELGELQSAEVPGALEGVEIDAIFVSTLVRTSETAAPLARARGLQPIELPGIHEIGAGELEGRTDKDSKRTYLEAVFAWGLGQRDKPMPGGGNGHDFFDRFDASIADAAALVSSLADGSGTAVVFSHGAAIRVWVAARATNVSPTFAASHELDNTGIVELDGSPETGWSLSRWQGTPIGGLDLADGTAEDPTGETLAEARSESTSST